jgi:hypothetical protein
MSEMCRVNNKADHKKVDSQSYQFGRLKVYEPCTREIIYQNFASLKYSEPLSFLLYKDTFKLTIYGIIIPLGNFIFLPSIV